MKTMAINKKKHPITVFRVWECMVTAISVARRRKSVVNLITGFIDTDAVSLNGSSTVSETTVASWSGVLFSFRSTSTIFSALSQAPPSLP
jgi:hypothetical protein